MVLMIDGIHFGDQVLVVARGIAEGGEKHVLGVWQGPTENTTVVKGLLEDLADRGLNLQRRYLVVIDGSKAASRCKTIFRPTGGSTALPDSQVAECEGAPAGEQPERLRGNAEAALDGNRKVHMELLTTVPLLEQGVGSCSSRMHCAFAGLIIDDLGMRKLGPTADFMTNAHASIARLATVV